MKRFYIKTLTSLRWQHGLQLTVDASLWGRYSPGPQVSHSPQRFTRAASLPHSTSQAPGDIWVESPEVKGTMGGSSTRLVRSFLGKFVTSRAMNITKKKKRNLSFCMPLQLFNSQNVPGSLGNLLWNVLKSKVDWWMEKEMDGYVTKSVEEC